jgi:hypothetical protein
MILKGLIQKRLGEGSVVVCKHSTACQTTKEIFDTFQDNFRCILVGLITVHLSDACEIFLAIRHGRYYPDPRLKITSCILQLSEY